MKMNTLQILLPSHAVGRNPRNIRHKWNPTQVKRQPPDDAQAEVCDPLDELPVLAFDHTTLLLNFRLSFLGSRYMFELLSDE
jgi:hypothetical protein